MDCNAFVLYSITDNCGSESQPTIITSIFATEARRQAAIDKWLLETEGNRRKDVERMTVIVGAAVLAFIYGMGSYNFWLEAEDCVLQP